MNILITFTSCNIIQFETLYENNLIHPLNRITTNKENHEVCGGGGGGVL